MLTLLYKILSWENKLSSHEEDSVAATFTTSFLNLHTSSHEVANLLQLLSFFDVEGVSTDVIIAGTRSAVLAPEPISPLQLKLVQNSDSTGRRTMEQGLRLRLREQWLHLQRMFAREKRTIESPKNMIEDISVERIDLQNLFRLIQTPLDLHLAIGKLHALSLVVPRGGSERPMLHIHDLVQYLIQYSVTTHMERKFWAEQAGKVIANAFAQIPDPESYVHWPQCELYSRHVVAVAAHAEKFKIESLEIFEVLERCSTYFLSRGRYEDAEKLCVQALAGMESLLGNEHLRTLSVVMTMAWVVYRRGNQKLSLAHDLYQRALTGRGLQLGWHHPDTLTTLNDLGFICEKEGLYAMAEKFLIAAMNGREYHFGPDHPATCLTKRNLGFLKFKEGRLAQAEEYSVQALVGEENSLGREHSETIVTATNLALIYEKQGQYGKAEELTLRSLEAREKQLGENHPRTLVSVNNLASIFEKQGKYGEAEVLYSRALTGRERMIGPDHPRTHLTVQNLALLYERMGRLEEAELYCNRALAGKKNHLGSQHPETLVSQARLASIYEKLARFTEAEELCHHVLAQEQALGPSHSAILTASQVLARVYMDQGS